MKKVIFILGWIFLFTNCSYHPHQIQKLPSADLEKKILFIAFDGIDFELVKELKEEGYFKDFQDPIPLNVTFPSATTIGFTGIFQPLHVGEVPGYETRFYSIEQNKIVGGTPFDIYKIPINYKTYFDSFRHKMSEKAIMYGFPSMAGRQDLDNTEKVLLESDKKVLMTYLGGTDGAQHLLGRKRTKRFMIFADKLIQRMKKRYHEKYQNELRVVLFSDHGFHHSKLKLVSSHDINQELSKIDLKLNHKIDKDQDVVSVKFGLLSAGIFFTKNQNKEPLAKALSKVTGVDLAFWEDHNRIYIINSAQELAYFEFNYFGQKNTHPKTYRYQTIDGDPLKYLPILEKSGYSTHDWLTDKTWYEMTWNHDYPDSGYRLFDSFHYLVKNKANVMMSLKPEFQYGSMGALIGTQLKFGHKGTHGGLFKSTTQGMVMTDDWSVNLPDSLRYDQMFLFFLPYVTKAYIEKYGQREIDMFFLE